MGKGSRVLFRHKNEFRHNSETEIEQDLGPPRERSLMLLPPLVALMAAILIAVFIHLSHRDLVENHRQSLSQAVKEIAIALDLQLGHLFKDISLLAARPADLSKAQKELETLKLVSRWRSLRVAVMDGEGRLIDSLGDPLPPIDSLIGPLIDTMRLDGTPRLTDPFEIGGRSHAMLIMPRLAGGPSGPIQKGFVAVAFALTDLTPWMRSADLPRGAAIRLQRNETEPWLAIHNQLDATDSGLPLKALMRMARHAGLNAGVERLEAGSEEGGRQGGYVAWRRLEGLDLIITASLSDRALWKLWSKRYLTPLLSLGIAALLITLGAAAITWTILVSNRRQAQARQALIKSEARYRDLVDSVSDFLWEMDSQCCVQEVSHTIEERLGLPAAHFLGRTLRDLVDECYEPDRLAEAEAALKHRRVFRDIVVRLVLPGDGRVVYMELSGKPLFKVTQGNDPVFEGFRGTASDVTMRIQAEQAAASARQRLASAIQSLQDGVALFDHEDRLILCNAAFTGLAGWDSPSDLEGMPFETLIREIGTSGRLAGEAEDNERWVSSRLKQHGQGHYGGMTLFADGRWVMTVDHRTPDNGAFLVFRDISELKAREAKLVALAQENQRLVRAIRAAAVGVMISDPHQPDNPILFVNDAFLERTGFEGRGLLGQPAELVLSADLPPRFIERARTAITADTPLSETMLARRGQEGHWWCRVTVDPVGQTPEGQPGDEPDSVIYIKADVTALVEAKEAAELANKTKSEFIAVMGHELRTPLNAIIGFADLLVNEAHGPLGTAVYHDFATEIQAGGSHLLALVNDLLDLSKAEAGRLELDEEIVDMAEILRSSLSLMQQRAQSQGLLLVLHDLPSLPLLYADPRKLKQIVLNLIANAIKFTPSGGRIDVSVHAAAGAMTLQVTDSGVGIAPEDLDKVLQLYGQARNPLSHRHPGTGLGLPLAKRLVELHDGEMTIDSTVDVGTTITLRLPASRFRSKDDL